MPVSERVGFGVVGFGAHVQNTILRLFDDDAHRAQLRRIFVRDAARYRAAHPALARRFTDRFEDLLEDAAIDALYVATPIATHFGFAQAALAAGKHVLCEKPLTQSLELTVALARSAARHGRILAEMTMYRHHRQFAWIARLLHEQAVAGECLIAAQARFAIPHLPPGDVRYDATGGGALLDIGYYPLSAAVALFGAPNRIERVRRVARDPGVDLSGAARLIYADFACECSWAIGTAYANALSLDFGRSSYGVPRAFSTPRDYETVIDHKRADGTNGDAVRIPADDHFARIFDWFGDAIRRASVEQAAAIADDAVRIATVIDRIQRRVDPPVG